MLYQSKASAKPYSSHSRMCMHTHCPEVPLPIVIVGADTHNYWLVVLLVTPAYSLVAPGVEQGRELQVRRAPARRFARAQLAVNTHTDCNGELNSGIYRPKG